MDRSSQGAPIIYEPPQLSVAQSRRELSIADRCLTGRRRAIIAMAADGLMDKQIGDKLGISESTVRNHWQHIFTKLTTPNRTSAVAKALRMGLI